MNRKGNKLLGQKAFAKGTETWLGQAGSHPR